MSQYVTRKDIQFKFDVSHTTVQNWEKKGWIRPYGFDRGVAIYDPEEIDAFDPADPPEVDAIMPGRDPNEVTISELIKALKSQQDHLTAVLKIVCGPGTDMLTTYGETVRHAVTAANEAQEKVKEMWTSHLASTREIEMLRVEQEKDERGEKRKDAIVAAFGKNVPLVAAAIAAKHSPEIAKTMGLMSDPRAGQLLTVLKSITPTQLDLMVQAGVVSKEQSAFIQELVGDEQAQDEPGAIEGLDDGGDDGEPARVVEPGAGYSATRGGAGPLRGDDAAGPPVRVDGPPTDDGGGDDRGVHGAASPKGSAKKSRGPRAKSPKPAGE